MLVRFSRNFQSHFLQTLCFCWFGIIPRSLGSYEYEYSSTYFPFLCLPCSMVRANICTHVGCRPRSRAQCRLFLSTFSIFHLFQPRFTTKGRKFIAYVDQINTRSEKLSNLCHIFKSVLFHIKLDPFSFWFDTYLQFLPMSIPMFQACKSN